MINGLFRIIFTHIAFIFANFLPDKLFNGKKYTFMGDIFTCLGHHKVAVDFYKKAAINHHEDESILKKLIASLSKLESYSEALNLCKKASITCGDYETLYQWARILDKQGRYLEAAEKYKQVISLNPNFFSAYFNLAHVLDELSYYDDAIKYHKLALELSPENPHVLVGMALTYEAMEQYGMACHFFEQAIIIDPLSAEAYFGWGTVLEKMKNYEGAITKYQLALQIDPGYSEVIARWGEVLFLTGDFDGAIKKYDEAIKINPNFSWAVYDLACAYAKLNKTNQAVKYLKKAIIMDVTLIEDIKDNSNLSHLVKNKQLKAFFANGAT